MLAPPAPAPPPGRAQVLQILHLLQLHQIVHHRTGVGLLVVHRVHDLALGARRGVGRGHQSEPMVDRRARPLLLHQATVQLNQVWRALGGHGRGSRLRQGVWRRSSRARRWRAALGRRRASRRHRSARRSGRRIRHHRWILLRAKRRRRRSAAGARGAVAWPAGSDWARPSAGASAPADRPAEAAGAPSRSCRRLPASAR